MLVKVSSRSLAGDPEDGELSIYDINGQLVLQTELPQITISTRDLNTGLYMVEVVHDDVVYRAKWVKE